MLCCCGVEGNAGIGQCSVFFGNGGGNWRFVVALAGVEVWAHGAEEGGGGAGAVAGFRAGRRLMGWSRVEGVGGGEERWLGLWRWTGW